MGGYSKKTPSNKARKRDLRNSTFQIAEGTVGAPCCPAMVFDTSSIQPTYFSHNDPLVVEMKVANSTVKRVLAHSGSCADVMTLGRVRQLKYGEADLTPLERPLFGFGGQSIFPAGTVKLPVRIGEKGKGEAFPSCSQ